MDCILPMYFSLPTVFSDDHSYLSGLMFSEVQTRHSCVALKQRRSGGSRGQKNNWHTVSADVREKTREDWHTDSPLMLPLPSLFTWLHFLSAQCFWVQIFRNTKLMSNIQLLLAKQYQCDWNNIYLLCQELLDSIWSLLFPSLLLPLTPLTSYIFFVSI